jgi:hypothetical protein
MHPPRSQADLEIQKFFSYLISAPMKLTAPQSLRPQEIVVVKIAPAHLEATIPESLVAVEVSIAEPTSAAMPNHIADNGSSCGARTAAVPTTITRVVTVNESIALSLLAAAATSLREADGRDCDEQNQTRD